MYYYSHHIGDFAKKTAHLSMLEEAAYRRMLDIYYATERPLPRSQQTIYRLVRARTHAEKLAVDIVIGEFFYESPEGWRNKRADEEILASKDKSDKARVAAETRWKNADAMRTHSERNAIQYPITKNQEPITKEVAVLPDWLPKDSWKAWLEVRRQKKAPNTPRALNMALTELTRLRSLGHDPAQVLDQSTLKGWKSVYPLSETAPIQEPVSQLCDYCQRVSVGSTNGRRHCSLHSDSAMDNIRPDKPRLVGITPKAVSGA